MIDNTLSGSYLLDDRNRLKDLIANDIYNKQEKKDPFEDLPSLAKIRSRNNFLLEEKYCNDDDKFGSSETLSNDNCDESFKKDKWFNSNLKNLSKNDLSQEETETFSQGYSLFSSGTNLLQNAGIYIPPITNRTSPSVGC